MILYLSKFAVAVNLVSYVIICAIEIKLKLHSNHSLGYAKVHVILTRKFHSLYLLKSIIFLAHVLLLDHFIILKKIILIFLFNVSSN